MAIPTPDERPEIWDDYDFGQVHGALTPAAVAQMERIGEPLPALTSDQLPSEDRSKP